MDKDEEEVAVVVPGDGDGADEYDDRNNKAEDGSNGCKPAALPPLGGSIRIGRHDNASNDDSNCDETKTTTLTAMTSKDS